MIQVAEISPEHIVLLGQSLGTAVASAVALRFADPTSTLLPQPPKLAEAEVEPLLNNDSYKTIFKGIVLVAPFASLPSLMLTYRLSGVVPLLAPLRPFPWITKPVLSRMVDQWPTADRLAAYYRTLSTQEMTTGERCVGSLQILHATSDMDISWRQTAMIVERVLGDQGAKIDATGGAALLEVRGLDRPAVRVEIGQYGGEYRNQRKVTSTPSDSC